MIALTDTYATVLNSGGYTDGEKVLLLKWLLDRSVALPEKLRGVAEVMGADMDGIAERMEEVRHNRAKRQQRWRKRKAGQVEVDVCRHLQPSTASTSPSPFSPPAPPLYPHTPEDVVAVARACVHVKPTPTLDEVLAFAADSAHHPGAEAFDAAWAREWWQFMENADPPWTDRSGARIGSWKQKMIVAWKLHGKDGVPTPGGGKVTRGRFAPQEKNKRGLD